MPRNPQKRQRGKHQRLFVFTINNPTETTDDELFSLVVCERKLTYIGFEHEVGENGTPHIQGFFRCKSEVLSIFGLFEGSPSAGRDPLILPGTARPTAPFPTIILHINFKQRYERGELQKWTGLESAWIQPMKGSIKQNVDYCSKDDNFIEVGSRPDSNVRADLQHLYKAVRKGQTDLELCEAGHFGTWSRSLKAVDRVRLAIRPTTEGRQVELHVGSTGTGKTRQVYDKYPDLYEVPVSKKGDLWFDGYSGEKVALIDEFSGQMALNSALKVLDQYYVRKVPTKGSFVWWNPERIVVTSNISPKKWYNWEKRAEQEKALRRRFHKIFVYQEDGTVEDVNIRMYWPIDGDFALEDANPVPVEQCLGPQAIAAQPFNISDSDEEYFAQRLTITTADSSYEYEG